MRLDGQPLCLLLLPRTLEEFILRDQAEDLLRAPGVVAADPPRVPYGALARMPPLVAEIAAGGQARRLLKALPGPLRVVVVFHPVQEPLAAALLARSGPDCELWYARWDRYELAYDADPRMRRRLEELHERTAARSSLTFAASVELGRLEEEAGREVEVVGLAADAFPSPPVGDGGHPAVVAVSLGHLGRRTDWALLRAVASRMPELTTLLIGEFHPDEVAGDDDAAWCHEHPSFVWLGRRSDTEAARLIGCADVGVLPFLVEPFNDAGLPYRILKVAKAGRRTVTPDLAGVRTWAEAVDVCADADAVVAALRAQAGRRVDPDLELRRWAMAQTAERVNAPLWARLRELGVLGA